MKKNNIKATLLATLTSVSILLTGCQSKDITKKDDVIKENPPVIESQTVTSSLEENTQVATPSPNPNNIVEQEDSLKSTGEEKTEPVSPSTNPSSSNPDKKEFTFFKDAKKEISSYIDSEDFNKLKEKGKYYITTGIDFIFYNKDINGVYFNDLTDEIKLTIIKDIRIIDEAIMSYYPNYKDTISNKYRIASEFISEKYLDVLDRIREYLGNENYEAVGEIKNQILGDISNKKDEAVDYIKNKYNDWKNR